jgi:hypothetical protein
MESSEGSSLSVQPKDESSLSPLAIRLVMALRHVADKHSELQMVVRGFEKHMRKNPFDDEEIRSGLGAIRAHINAILDDVDVTATSPHATQTLS